MRCVRLFPDFKEVTFQYLVYDILNTAVMQQESLDAGLDLDMWNR